MVELFAAAYPWLKALHVACVILWVGPQLALAPLVLAPGLRETPADDGYRSWLAGMFAVWMNLAMLGAFLFGGLMAVFLWVPGAGWPLWFWVKIGAVFALSLVHGGLFRQVRLARTGRDAGFGRWRSALQAAGFAAVFSIVAMVIVKPWI